MPLHQNFFA